MSSKVFSSYCIWHKISGDDSWTVAQPEKWMYLTGIDLVLWATGFIGNIVLLTVLFIRHRIRSFPVFSTLISSDVAKTLILYLIIVFSHHKKHTYLVVYTSLAVIDLALQLCVIYELASYVFRPLGTWARDVRNGFIWLICISIPIATGLTYLADIAPARSWLQSQLVRGNFFSAILMSELFMGMVVLSLTVHLPWKTHVARIAQGLGIYSIFCIVIEAGHSYLGIDHDPGISHALSHIRIGIYQATVGYWIVMLWLEAPAPNELPEQLRAQLFLLQRRMEYDLGKLRSWRKS